MTRTKRTAVAQPDEPVLGAWTFFFRSISDCDSPFFLRSISDCDLSVASIIFPKRVAKASRASRTVGYPTGPPGSRRVGHATWRKGASSSSGKCQGLLGDHEPSTQPGRDANSQKHHP